MGSIVAIGGGDVSTLVTQPIDTEIIGLSGSSSPKALFIPTASSDSVEYWEGFDRAYRENYGCETDVLYLLGQAPSPESMAQKIEWADVIYVGGGNTLKMMRRWRRLGVDDLLRSAHARGAVLCGVSAGAICWFDRGSQRLDVVLQPRRLELHSRHRHGTSERPGVSTLQRGHSRRSPKAGLPRNAETEGRKRPCHRQ